MPKSRVSQQYTAVVKEDGGWWIGWIEEVPGVNCQERTREELLETLWITLREILDLNREGGRHSIWKNPKLDRLTAVPRHAEVNDHLARKICKDLGIEPPRR